MNDHLASVVSKYPKRFIGCATVPLQSPQLCVEELKRSVTELGHKAVMIGSHVNDWNLDCRALDPFYKVTNLGIKYATSVLQALKFIVVEAHILL